MQRKAWFVYRILWYLSSNDDNDRASTSTRWHFALGAVVIATKPMHRLQIRPIVHKWRTSPTIPPSYIQVCAVVWECGEGQTDMQTQTVMITIDFASAMPHAKCNNKVLTLFSRSPWLHFFSNLVWAADNTCRITTWSGQLIGYSIILMSVTVKKWTSHLRQNHSIWMAKEVCVEIELLLLYHI